MSAAGARLALPVLGVVVVALVPLEARAQGVLARGADGAVACVTGGVHSHVGAVCDEISCPAPRVCIEVPDLGARCVDLPDEIVCVPGDAGCDGCPMTSLGADPEVCRVIELEDGPHALCIYGAALVCVGESALDVAACVPVAGDTPSVAAGDCDADGVANADDRCLCEHAPGSVDGCPFDGGVEDADASVARDSGTRGLDAAGSEPDAASLDAAAAPERPSFRGGGGCACRAAGTRAGLGWLAIAPVLAALARRRRRAGARL